MNGRVLAVALSLGFGALAATAAGAAPFTAAAHAGVYAQRSAIEAVRDHGQLSRKQVYRALVRQGYDLVHITGGGRLWTVRAEDQAGHDVVLQVNPWTAEVVSERRLRAVHRRGDDRRGDDRRYYDDGGRRDYDDRGGSYDGGYDDPGYGSDY